MNGTSLWVASFSLYSRVKRVSMSILWKTWKPKVQWPKCEYRERYQRKDRVCTVPVCDQKWRGNETHYVIFCSNMVMQKRKIIFWKRFFKYTFFLLRTSKILPRLNVINFLLTIWGSKCSYFVLNCNIFFYGWKLTSKAFRCLCVPRF